MRFFPLSCVVLTFAVFQPTFPVYGGEPAGRQSSDAAPIVNSVTVFPIVLNSGAPIAGVSADMPKNVAQIVGLFLERGEVKHIEIAEANFTPPEKADLAKAAKAFGQFVQSQHIKTQYALFGQFIGTPGKGVDEIRLAVVDPQGKVVLAKRLDRQQLLWGGEKKVDLMRASYCLVSELRAPWGLADPDQRNAPEGKMANLWDEKSGLPPKAEQAAMQTRLKTLKQTIKASTLAVFVRVSGSSDAKAAQAMAAMLSHEGLGRARAAGTGLTFQVKGNTNEMRILWDTARAFQSFLRKNPPTANYALLADYGIGRAPDGTPVVGGVHFILCNHNGDWVLLGLQNSEHPAFQRINPQSPDDCNRLLIEDFKDRLR